MKKVGTFLQPALDARRVLHNWKKSAIKEFFLLPQHFSKRFGKSIIQGAFGSKDESR